MYIYILWRVLTYDIPSMENGTRAQGSFVRGSLVVQATTLYFEGDV